MGLVLFFFLLCGCSAGSLSLLASTNRSVALQTQTLEQSPNAQELWWIDSTTSTVDVYDTQTYEVTKVMSWDPKHLPLGQFTIRNATLGLAAVYTGSFLNPGQTGVLDINLTDFSPSNFRVLPSLANGTHFASFSFDPRDATRRYAYAVGTNGTFLGESNTVYKIDLEKGTTTILYRNASVELAQAAMVTMHGQLVISVGMGLLNGRAVLVCNVDTSHCNALHFEAESPPLIVNDYMYGVLSTHGVLHRIPLSNLTLDNVQNIDVPIPPVLLRNSTFPCCRVAVSDTHLFQTLNTAGAEVFQATLWVGRTPLSSLTEWDSLELKNVQYGFYSFEGYHSYNVAIGDKLFGTITSTSPNEPFTMISVFGTK